jgi:hypothetical protein
MSTDQDVAIARAVLHQAEAVAHDEHRKELVERLGKVRAEKREAEATYLKLATQIKAEREWEADIRAQINQVRDAIGDSWAARPTVADLLPEDPEVKAWRKGHESLERERDKLAARLAAQPRTSIVDAVRYEGPTGILFALECAEANLLAQLDPEARRRRLEGGVHPVR